MKFVVLSNKCDVISRNKERLLIPKVSSERLLLMRESVIVEEVWVGHLEILCGSVTSCVALGKSPVSS